MSESAEPTAPNSAEAHLSSGSASREWASRRWDWFTLHRPSHLVVVVVIVLAGLAVSILVALRSQSTLLAAPLPMVTPSTTSAHAAPPSGSSTPTPTPKRIMVHVLGQVSKPGVCQLPEGSRVVDAIAAAGGLRADADPAELNFAALLVDGSQVLIGASAAPRGEVRNTQTSSTSGSPDTGAVGLNSATTEQLQQLPGVGPVTAAAIVEWRDTNGPFTSVGQLVEVSGIGEKTLAQLEDLVSVQ